MSDLQISLLIIGAVVVVAVVLYNSYQQRQLRKRLGEAFGEPHQDVLLGEGRDAVPASRIEPQMDTVRTVPAVGPAAQPAAASPGHSTPDAPPAVANIDEAIDCVATLSSDTPLTVAQVAEVLSGVASCGRSWRAAGFNSASGRWEEVNRAVTGQYTRLRLALQMANRGGPLSAVQLGAFADALNMLATRFSAHLQFPDADKVLAEARALDAFCADVDVAIGINVIATDSDVFSAARVRALVESEGFKLEPDGVFHLEDGNENTLLNISNQESAPFLPEAVGAMTTQGLTILLDVPRVADADHALQRMFELGRTLSVTLKGRMVDDNRAALTAMSMDKIRK
ncbi:MAG TPA: cell division protein ZipA C-terminal FtsZ-binding domain-containing protein, partial [Burkholderiales bacterium]|nr:cell division protein ZipA C-terminal FtsZ-binding domain-containing protein [Burkholderiales bacterium]